MKLDGHWRLNNLDGPEDWELDTVSLLVTPAARPLEASQKGRWRISEDIAMLEGSAMFFSLQMLARTQYGGSGRQLFSL